MSFDMAFFIASSVNEISFSNLRGKLEISDMNVYFIDIMCQLK